MPRDTLQALEAHEVDLNTLVFDLQRARIEKFCASFDEVLGAFDRKVESLLAGPGAFT